MKNIRGFTLIELSIVLLISGVAIAAALSLYTNYLRRVQIEKTYSNVFDANQLMQQAWDIEKRYFCPADPTLPPGDPNYGRERADCASAVAVGSCTGGATGVCVGNGLDTTVDTDAAPDRVVIGMLPFVTIAERFEAQKTALLTVYNDPATDKKERDAAKRKLDGISLGGFAKARKFAFDGWGNQLTYAVSASMANATTANVKGGAIQVNNTFGTSDNTDGVHFVMISHGKNAKAAYNALGVRPTACGVGMSALETENCDIDGVFSQTTISSTVENATESDDIVIYNNYVARELWSTTTCTDGTKLCIMNKNPGNVGVGLIATAIDNALTIGGDLRAEKTITDEICDKTGANCFDPDKIGGTGLDTPCDSTGLPAHQMRVAVEVENKRTVCSIVNRPYHQECAPNELMVGFNPDGTIACITNVAPAPPPLPPGASCTDECGETRAHGELWCRAGPWPIKPAGECVNGLIINQPAISGIGCDAAADHSCP